MRTMNPMDQINRFKDTLKVGDAVLIHPYMQDRRVERVFSINANESAFWINNKDGLYPMKWKDIIEIYSKEEYPEYYL